MKTILKDLLTVEEGIICQQVNCQGKHNSGLAKAVREKWPFAFEQYAKFCERFTPGDLLGGVQTIQISDRLFLCNLFCQLNYGYDGRRYTSYGAWEIALPKIKQFVDKMKESMKDDYFPIWFPYNVGSDRGGAKFEFIKHLIEEVFPEAIFCKI